MTTPTTAAQPKKPNKITFDELLATATDLGKQEALGKDGQVKMLLKVFEGSFLNTIDLTEHKHGKDVDDCTKLAETYVKARSGNTVFDAKANNQKKLISCFRTMTKLGTFTKCGPGEPATTLNNLVAMRQKLRQDPTQAKLLQDAANTVLVYARQQIRRDQLIDGDELRSFCFKKLREERSIEEEIKAAHATVMKIHAKDKNNLIKTAADALNARLKQIANEQKATAAARHAAFGVAIV